MTPDQPTSRRAPRRRVARPRIAAALTFGLLGPAALPGQAVASSTIQLGAAGTHKGVVQILPGRLVAYAPIYNDRDGNCCPSFTQRNTIRSRNGRFIIASSPRLPTRHVNIPPGDLG